MGRQLCGAALNEWVLTGCAGGLLLGSLLCRRAGIAPFMPVFLLAGMILGREPSIPLIPEGIIAARVCDEMIPAGNGSRTLIDRIHCLEQGRWVRVRGKASVYLAGETARAGPGQTDLHPDSMRPNDLYCNKIRPGSYLFAKCRLSPYAPP